LVREGAGIAPILDCYKACGHPAIVLDETNTAVILAGTYDYAGANLVETDSAVFELVETSSC
jgi:hypothetical protein